MMEKQYNHERKAFIITDQGNEVAIVPFLFPDINHRGDVFSEVNVAKYSFSFYYKKDVPEIDYHLVNINVGAGGGHPQRLGWIIPLAALTSEDDDTRAFPFLNDFVFWAFCYLLSQDTILKRIAEDRDAFSDILDTEYPDGCIFIIDKDQMPEGITEKHLELSLARNGFFQVPSGYKNPQIVLPKGAELSLTPASEIINAEGHYLRDYLDEFLKQHAYNSNSFIRFFYLYQIVEILLDAEMIELLRDFANKIENDKATYLVADKALQKNTDSARFSRVVEHSGITIDQYADLDRVCNAFLGSDPAKPLKNPESVYQVRNHIVHRFRKAASDVSTVKDICDYLELYLYDLLINYKLPNANG